jgi:hypothetical protein
MTFSEEILNYFPPDYWGKWERMFGHDFAACHMARTSEYDIDFVARDFKDKTVLEVGGFPGLEIALYFMRNIKSVVAIDHPDYRPEWYLAWADEHFVKSIAHDTNKGAPPMSDDAHFDVMCMSDVLLHNSGFPSEFLAWCIGHCDKIYMLNQTGETTVQPAGIMNLHSGFSMPKSQHIISEMERLGAKISYTGESGGRNLLIFEGKTNEILDSDTPLRDERTSGEAVPDSGTSGTHR